MQKEFIISGFGGQGILFIGKLLAYTGMKNNYQVSWLPSYGPEMRGGTASCNVIISDDAIGSPLVTEATEVIAMNGPSFVKFEKSVAPGGTMYYDSSLVTPTPTRTDINYIGVDATKLATEMGMGKLANMFLIGKVLKESKVFEMDVIFEALKGLVPAKKPELYDLNKKAIEAGANL